MGTEETKTDLSPQVVMEIAEEIGESKTFRIQDKIPDKHLTFIGGKDVNGGIIAAVLLLLLLLSFFIIFIFFFFIIMLIVSIVGYSYAKENTLSLDISENHGEKNHVTLIADGEKANSLMKDILFRIMMRERLIDTSKSQSDSIQNQNSAV